MLLLTYGFSQYFIGCILIFELNGGSGIGAQYLGKTDHITYFSLFVWPDIRYDEYKKENNKNDEAGNDLYTYKLIADGYISKFDQQLVC